MAHMMLTLCAIGCTGVGKSSLCNLLSGGGGTPGGCDAPGGLGVSSGIDACTQHTVTGVHKWLGTGESVKLIDTPGKIFYVYPQIDTADSKCIIVNLQTVVIL